MTKAVFIDQTGGPETLTLRDHDLGPPQAGELRVRHTAIGLNFIDIYQRRGLYPVSLPAILGSEAVGVVEAVGPDAGAFKPGDRIAHLAPGGAYAETANIPAVMAALIPDGVPDDIAAASFLKGLTVEMLVSRVFHLGPDHACLVHAAAGGVGTLLCQWAKYIGAHVIAVVGSEAKSETAKSHGADDIIIRTATNSISTDVRRLTGGRGVNVVYDSVGQATFEASLDSLAPLGHMVTFGNASGPPPAIAPLDLSRRGSLTLTRPTLFHYATPDRLPQMAETLFGLLSSGVLTPKIGAAYPLAKIADAHRLLESGASAGAIVINP